LFLQGGALHADANAFNNRLRSHVGYDQETQQWGRSTRPLNPKEEERSVGAKLPLPRPSSHRLLSHALLFSTCCGMIAHRMSWFAAEYQRARLGVKFFKSPESASGVLLQVIVFSLLNQLPRISSS
jgi:hypothetical protein